VIFACINCNLQEAIAMSNWEYEAGRKAVWQNVVKGDFSNMSPHEYNTPEKQEKSITYAKAELLKEQK
jgi:hypothetical protein